MRATNANAYGLNIVYGNLGGGTNVPIHEVEKYSEQYGPLGESSRFSQTNLNNSLSKSVLKKWAVFGDSISSDPFKQMLPKLTNLFGFAGGAGMGYVTPYGCDASGSSTLTASSGNFFYNTYAHPNGTSFTVGSPNQVTGNCAVVYYMSKSGGGTFNLETNINGGGWNVAQSGISANGSADLSYAFVTNASSLWPIKIRGTVTSGTVQFCGGQITDHITPGGICLGTFDAPGETLTTQFGPTVSNNTWKFINFYKPTTVFLSYQDEVVEATANFTNTYSCITNASPGCSVVWVGGTDFTGSDPKSGLNNSFNFNYAIQTNCLAYQLPFYNPWPIFGNYTNAARRGLKVSETGNLHPTTLGYAAIAQGLWEFLGISDSIVYLPPAVSVNNISGTVQIRPSNDRDITLGNNNATDSAIWLGPTHGSTLNNANANLVGDQNGATRVNAASGQFIFLCVNQVPGYYLSSSGGTVFGDVFGNTADPGFGKARFNGDMAVTGTLTVTNGITTEGTITAGGTTGARTINKISGTVNFAAAATSLVVTCSKVTATSIVLAVVQTADATATIKNVVPGAGSFTINLGAAATAETKVGFLVINPI